MRLWSPEYRGCNEKASTSAKFLTAMLLLGVAIGGGSSQSAAQEAATDVAYVEAVSGRVVASSQGTPSLLDVLDVIGDRTRLDLQANSELRICHFRTHRLLSLTGPLKAWISRDNVTAENGKAIGASAGTCAAPVVSTFQGGLVSRSTGFKIVNVSLRPSIKIVNRGTQPIRKIALWDSEHQTLLMTFDRNAAQPILDEGQSYLLVIERSDGNELKMMLKGSAIPRTDPLIVVVR